MYICSIPPDRQKLRSGFPPRELQPPADPQQPVDLANGEKVSVDIIPPHTVAEDQTEHGSATATSTQEEGAGTESEDPATQQHLTHQGEWRLD